MQSERRYDDEDVKKSCGHLETIQMPDYVVRSKLEGRQAWEAEAPYTKWLANVSQWPCGECAKGQNQPAKTVETSLTAPPPPPNPYEQLATRLAEGGDKKFARSYSRYKRRREGLAEGQNLDWTPYLLTRIAAAMEEMMYLQYQILQRLANLEQLDNLPPVDYSGQREQERDRQRADDVAADIARLRRRLDPDPPSRD